MKWSIATAFVNKVFTLSDPIFMGRNIERIKNILRMNNYPMKLIKKAIQKYRTTRTSTYNNMENNPDINNNPEIKNNKYASVHYVPVLSENIARTFHTSIPDLTIAPKPARRLNMSFSNMKSRIGKFDQRNVIYSIPCTPNICTEDRYIGHTKRRLGIRTNEHNTDYENRHRTNGKTALIRHAINVEKESRREHCSDFENTRILDRESNKSKREFLEACHIWMHGHRSNNFIRDKNSLHNNYTYIINTYKDIQTS